jgi:hypothetical protein
MSSVRQALLCPLGSRETMAGVVLCGATMHRAELGIFKHHTRGPLAMSGDTLMVAAGETQG